MCGIVGLLSFNRNVAAWRDEIEQSVALMARRGPDDERIWSDDRACTLGFRRLAILDLSPTGAQPMVSADGRHVLVLNGEVYNFRELRRELEVAGVSFRSTGDAEVVLQALVRWGPPALARLNGMFALGFYDVRRRCLLLARDHAGIKPLYYLRSPEGLLFASQYDQILGHPWARRCPVDPAALALYLRLGYLPAPYAILRGTHAVEPGQWFEVCDDGTERRGRHFQFPVFREPSLCGPDVVEAVDAALTAAVRRHLVSDVPVGAFLSGGIDSPLILAKFRELAGSGPPIPAFTIGTPGSEYDESLDAAAYARELGVEHHLQQIAATDALALLEDVVSASGEPMDDYSLFPTMLVSRLARDHVKVVLSGDGGDELFWGYTGRAIGLLRYAASHRGRPSRWGAALARLRALGGRQSGDPPDTPGARFLAMQSFVPPGWMESIFPDLPAGPKEFDRFEFDSDDPDRLAQWIRWNEFSGNLPRILQKVDRASMFHSLEVRVPLLDRELVELASRIDWRACLDVPREIGKLPLRQALGRHVRHQTTSKRGFTVPMSEWLRGPLQEVFQDLVGSRSDLLGLGLRGDALRDRFRRHSTGEEDVRWGLWRLLSLSLWEARHYRPNAYAG